MLDFVLPLCSAWGQARRINIKAWHNTDPLMHTRSFPVPAAEFLDGLSFCMWTNSWQIPTLVRTHIVQSIVYRDRRAGMFLSELPALGWTVGCMSVEVSDTKIAEKLCMSA